MLTTKSLPRILLPVLMLCCSIGAQAQIVGTSPCAVTAELQGFPDDFYPPGSIRRAEEGEVIITFLGSPGDDTARDVQFARSSGVPDLDAAALKVARNLRVRSPCSARVARWAVHFDHESEQRPRPPQAGCVVLVWAIANVLVVPDESQED